MTTIKIKVIPSDGPAEVHELSGFAEAINFLRHRGMKDLHPISAAAAGDIRPEDIKPGEIVTLPVSEAAKIVTSRGTDMDANAEQKNSVGPGPMIPGSGMRPRDPRFAGIKESTAVARPPVGMDMPTPRRTLLQKIFRRG